MGQAGVFVRFFFLTAATDNSIGGSSAVSGLLDLLCYTVTKRELNQFGATTGVVRHRSSFQIESDGRLNAQCLQFSSQLCYCQNFFPLRPLKHIQHKISNTVQQKIILIYLVLATKRFKALITISVSHGLFFTALLSGHFDSAR